jgi:hypothetical protein
MFGAVQDLGRDRLCPLVIFRDSGIDDRSHAAFPSDPPMYQKSILCVRSVLPMIMCFIPSFMLLGIVPAIVSAVFNAFA